MDKIEIDEIVSEYKPDLIIHLAAYYKRNHSYLDIEEMFKTNIIFPTKILESMVKNKIKYFINTGTFFEYLIDEKEIKISSKLSPSNLYAVSKISFEDILKFYISKFEINAITFKLFAPYGYKDNPNKLIPYIINSALTGKTVEIFSENLMWDFVYVKDIVNAYVKGLKYLLSNMNKYTVFNVGSSEVHSIKEIIEIISSFGKRFQVNWNKDTKNESGVLYAKADITSTINTLGWYPQYSLYSGLLETYELCKRDLDAK